MQARYDLNTLGDKQVRTRADLGVENDSQARQGAKRGTVVNVMVLSHETQRGTTAARTTGDTVRGQRALSSGSRRADGLCISTYFM
jgi:hypothetical protein